MSAQGYEQEQEQRGVDPLFIAVLFVGLFLPVLVLPALVAVFAGQFARKQWFWFADAFEPWISWGKTLLLGAVALGCWVYWANDGHSFFFVWAVGLACGALMMPLMWRLMRVRWGGKVSTDRIDDVRLRPEMESARYRAARTETMQFFDYKINGKGMPEPVAEGAGWYGPQKLKATDEGARWLGNVIHQPRSLDEVWRDRKKESSWVTGRQWVTIPKARNCRALVFGASGFGKTSFLSSLMTAGVETGARVTFIDAKAKRTHGLAVAEQLGGKRFEKYDLFRGSAEEITERLGDLWGKTGGDGDHYRSQALNVIASVQAYTPLKSFKDLEQRLKAPGEHCLPERIDYLTGGRGESRAEVVLAAVWERFLPLQKFIGKDGWSWDDDESMRVFQIPAALEQPRRLGAMILKDLRRYMQSRLDKLQDSAPEIIVIDEFAQLTDVGLDPAKEAENLFLVAREADLGLVIAVQSPAAIALEDKTKESMFESGAAIFVGAAKSPEDVAKLSGTRERLEAGGDAYGAGLSGGRAQHTFNLPPDRVREMTAGEFFIIEEGIVTPVFMMPSGIKYEKKKVN